MWFWTVLLASLGDLDKKKRLLVRSVKKRGRSRKHFDGFFCGSYLSFALVSASWDSVSAIWDSSLEMEAWREDCII